MCDTGSQYRNRQCPGSKPRGQINKPAKTAQYGGERDCANSGSTGSKHEQNCNTFECNRKKISQLLIIYVEDKNNQINVYKIVQRNPHFRF